MRAECHPLKAYISELFEVVNINIYICDRSEQDRYKVKLNIPAEWTN